MRLNRLRVLVVLALVAAWVWPLSPPAGAEQQPLSVAMEFGRTTLATALFGPTVVHSPISGRPDCGLSDDIYVSSRFDGEEIVTLNADIAFPLTLPIFGLRYQLTATGSSLIPRPPGTVGTWDPTTGDFSGVNLQASSVVREVGSDGCAVGEGMCRGFLVLALSGTTRHQHPGGPMEGPIPWPEERDAAWINMTTTDPIRLVPQDPCPTPLSLLLPLARLELGANPSDPAHGDDPGAEFR